MTRTRSRVFFASTGTQKARSGSVAAKRRFAMKMSKGNALAIEGLEDRKMMAADAAAGGLSAEENVWLASLVDQTAAITLRVQQLSEAGSRKNLIVDMKSEAAAIAFAEALPNVERLGRSVVAGTMVIVSHASSSEAVRLKAAYETNQLVALAEEDGLFTIESTPNDPYFERLYGLDNTGQSGGRVDADIDAPEAWQVTEGSASVVVAVIDSGVDYTHPDLKNSMWVNADEIPGNGIDDDRNGFVDDVHGYDFVGNDSTPLDENGHGTHVAGTIAAQKDNAIGVVGVAPGVRIMALRFLNAGGGGDWSNAIRALDYAVANGAQISNNSYGAAAGLIPSFERALGRAAQAGHVFVAAAGNDGRNTDQTPFYPSGSQQANVISVAATDRSDRLASFSNYGSTTVDIAAPGVSILSTYPNNRYAFLDGTSMATPHVAGAAALVLSVNPTWSADQVITAVLNSGEKLAHLESKVASGARLNAQRAVAGEALNAPVLSAHAVTSSSVTLTWTDSNKETGYRIYRNGYLLKTLSANATTTEVSGLSPSTAYAFQVEAFTAGNAEKVGSNVVSVTTSPEAGEFVLTARDVTAESVRLSWTPASDVRFYRIFTDGEWGAPIWPADTSKVVTGLKPNTTYKFHIWASLNSGTATTNTVSVRTSSAGDSLLAPSLTAGSVSSSSVTLSWTDSNKETGYRVYRNGAVAKTLSANATTTEVSGLSPSTAYAFKVEAFTAGNAEKAVSNVVSVTTSPEAGEFVLTARDVTAESVRLSWTPASDVRFYRIFTDGVWGPPIWPADTSKVVTGLKPNTTYKFHIWASLNSGTATTNTVSVRTLSTQQLTQSAAAGWNVVGAEVNHGENMLVVERGGMRNRLVADSTWAVHSVFHAMRSLNPVVLSPLARGDAFAAAISVLAGNYTVGGKQNPPLTVWRGTTFTFEVDTPGHPLHLQARGGGYDPSAAYTDGVTGAGADRGVVRWVISEDAPRELFYQSESDPAVWGRLIVADLPA